MFVQALLPSLSLLREEVGELYSCYYYLEKYI